MTDTRRQFASYFHWLMFINVLIVAGEFLGKVHIFRFYRMPWSDVLASYAVIGTVGMMCAVVVAAICALWDWASVGAGWPALTAVPKATVMGLLLAVWLRLLLAAVKVIPATIPVTVQFLACWGAGIVVSALARRRLGDWIDETSGRLRVINYPSVVVFLALSAHLLADAQYPVGFRAVVSAEPHQRHPDVIIIVLDGLARSDMSLYGYKLRTTPNLDRLAKTWTVYEAANSTGTGTVDVLPAILTGRYTVTHDWYRYGDCTQASRCVSLPRALKALGYETGYIMGGGFAPGHYHLQGGFDWIRGGYKLVGVPGRDLLNLTRFTEYAIPDLKKPGVMLDEPMYEVAEQYFGRRASARDTRPAFVYLHMNRPHYPFIGGEFVGSILPVTRGFADIRSQQPYLFREYPFTQQAVLDRLRLRYDENILKADAEVGHLIQRLQDVGDYDQSLIMITADHGTSFTSGYQGYSTPLLSAVEHRIPLLVKFPGQTEGRRVRGLVTNIDIFPTVLDVVGVPAPTVDGESLLRSRPDNGRFVYVRLPSERPTDPHTFAVLGDNLKLVSRRGRLSLYNLDDDPNETRDVLYRLNGQSQVLALRRALDDFRRRIESAARD